MNLFRIARKNAGDKPLNTLLSVLLLSFGVGIISMLLMLEKQLTEKFDRNIKDIDLVLGAKGSPLQLILANVYHVDAPTGNIKVSDAQRVIHHPTIKLAIPLAYGDNYEKWRIVGTDKNYPDHYECSLEKGQLFETPFQVTLGAHVAEETHLKLGDEFQSIHGLDQVTNDEDGGHSTKYKVVGIFNRCDCAIDNLILTPVESVWMIHEHHDESAGDSIMADSTHKEEREMTAYLLVKRTPMAQMILPGMVKNTNMQLALPAIEVNRLSQNFGLGMETAKGVAILIMLLSFISVFISLYNSLKDRKYELALMRTIGGTRLKLFSLMLLEGLVLVVSGFIAGLILSRIALFVLSKKMEASFHYSLDNIAITNGEIILFLVTLAVGVLASLLPAFRAFHMDISKTLSNG